jgi:hypothetical protein
LLIVLSVSFVDREHGLAVLILRDVSVSLSTKSWHVAFTVCHKCCVFMGMFASSQICHTFLTKLWQATKSVAKKFVDTSVASFVRHIYL